MLSWNEILIRLSLACLFGALIGLERERKNWAAGLRTHMMVCVGSCLIMMVSAFGFSDILGTDNVTLDPSRIAAQVVSGIGFIGAGAILFQKQGGTIRGITTAAGLWTVAAIGLATGGGMYFAAGSTTIIAIIILWALQPLEYAFLKKYKQHTIKIVTSIDVSNKDLFSKIFNQSDIKVQNLTFNRVDDTLVFQLVIENNISEGQIASFVQVLKNENLVKEVSIVTQ
ncbi:MAG: MgtC/SapB family protein [Chitinophagaceae bacterium]|nr:MgtC/SapB family protein [Chitinophagaceae bacterium]MCW5904728.1 MgtC/SapB family protein [Chitinophagaceae bacterium]